jgi:hypothetical protein
MVGAVFIPAAGLILTAFGILAASGHL